MTIEIVRVALPEGMTRTDFVEIVCGTRNAIYPEHGVIEMNFVFDAETRTAGTVTVWNSERLARRNDSAAFRDGIKKVFGSEPTFEYFERIHGVAVRDQG